MVAINRPHYPPQGYTAEHAARLVSTPRLWLVWLPGRGWACDQHAGLYGLSSGGKGLAYVRQMRQLGVEAELFEVPTPDDFRRLEGLAEYRASWTPLVWSLVGCFTALIGVALAELLFSYLW